MDWADPLDQEPRIGSSNAAEPADLTFDALYEAYGGRVLNLAWRMTANEETARDMAQDIWLKVYQSLEGFEGKSHVFTWVYRIALNHILNHIKREKRATWLDILDRKVGEAVHEQAVDHSFVERTIRPSADRGMETSERAQAVLRVVQTLDPKYRVPLVLHHYEEMSYQDIAATLELSLSAVEARIHRAKRQVIQKLGPLIDQL